VKIRDRVEFELVARSKGRLSTLPPAAIAASDSAAVSPPAPVGHWFPFLGLLAEEAGFDFPFPPCAFPRGGRILERDDLAAANQIPQGREWPDRGRRWK
jgi:hypothetical protein